MTMAAGILRETGRCHGCGVVLKYAPVSWKRQNKFYCSSECMSSCPPLLARAMEERKIRKPRECVLAILRSYPSVAVAANAVGTDKWTMYRWIERYGIRREVVWS